VLVRPLRGEDQQWRLAALEASWGATTAARLGELIDTADLPGFVAVDGDCRVGLLTFIERPDGIEVVTIEASISRRGVGRALMDAVLARAVEVNAPRVWLVTTSDNDAAIAFYRGCGMILTCVVADGVAASRRVKPSIPMIGADELLFERTIG
jgi:ribosomal protein S18 acetylase RimI-like enzyme